MTKLSRREFLRGAVLAGTGALLPKVEQSTGQVQAVERAIEVNTGPEIADRHFESYHSVSFDFDLEQCIANLPGLRGFWPWPKLESFEYGDFLVHGNGTFVDGLPKITIGRVPEIPREYKAELSVKYGTPPSTPQRTWHTTICFVPAGTRRAFLNE